MSAPEICVCGHPRGDHSWIEYLDIYEYCYMNTDCDCGLFVPAASEEHTS